MLLNTSEAYEDQSIKVRDGSLLQFTNVVIIIGRDSDLATGWRCLAERAGRRWLELDRKLATLGAGRRMCHGSSRERGVGRCRWRIRHRDAIAEEVLC
jgi:hypothetical protein